MFCIVLPPLITYLVSLPSEDQFPDDLKPLVRRQAYEISNKRWKYDTEQLIRFLIKLGITPKPYLPPPPPASKSWWGRNYLWVIIVSVALVVISAIASNTSDYCPEPLKSIRPSYDNGSTVNPNPVPNDDDTEGIPAVETATVNGTWYDAKNGLYYLDINQNGSTLNITSYSLGGYQTAKDQEILMAGKYHWR